MKKSLLFLLLILILGPIFADSTLEAKLTDSLNTIGEKAFRPFLTAFGPICFELSQEGTPFSRYLEDQFSMAFTNCNKFNLFDGHTIKNIDESFGNGYKELLDNKDIDAVLSCNFFPSKNTIRLRIKITSLAEGGSLLGMQEININRDLIPSSVAITPEDAAKAAKVRKEITQITKTKKAGFEIKAVTDRGKGGVYRVGELLKLHFYTSRDAYIKIYHIDVNQKMTLIFPNQFYGDNFVKARQLYKIPDNSYPFDFVMTEPTGTEFIKIFASTVQFKDIEESFTELGKASRQSLSRGIYVQGRSKAEINETTLEYKIIK